MIWFLILGLGVILTIIVQIIDVLFRLNLFLVFQLRDGLLVQGLVRRRLSHRLKIVIVKRQLSRGLDRMLVMIPELSCYLRGIIQWLRG